jgi:hypothetical protein
MKHKREFDTSYLHNPHSLGGELLPLHYVAEGDGVNGVEVATRSGPTVSPLLSSQSSDPYNKLRVSLPPHHKIARWWGIYSRF